MSEVRGQMTEPDLKRGEIRKELIVGTIGLQRTPPRIGPSESRKCQGDCGKCTDGYTC